MSFLSSIKKVLNIGSERKKPKGFHHIKADQVPEDTWEIIGELGKEAWIKDMVKEMFFGS